MRSKSKRGMLIIIGGGEDKTESKTILKEIAQQTGRGKLVIVTIASKVPQERWEEYRNVFKSLNVKEIVHFNIQQHRDALDAKNLDLFKGAKAVFFTGGDQLKITTKIGGTPVIDKIFEIYNKGGLVAGTSAGASAMGKTMLVCNEEMDSHKVGGWSMAPGLGMLEDILIDQHFAQRHRLGRLLGAVASNPGVLGIGLDEDTAIVIEKNSFKVIGRNAVYVIDGSHVTSTNISEAAATKTMSMHGVRLHILANFDSFDLRKRRPYRTASKSQISAS